MFIDTTADTLNSTAVVSYHVHVVLMNCLTNTRHFMIGKGPEVAKFRPVMAKYSGLCSVLQAQTNFFSSIHDESLHS